MPCGLVTGLEEAAVGTRLHPQTCSEPIFPPLPATRIQFFAIEIARNREGCNSVVYNSAKKPAAAVAEEAVTA